MTVIGLTGPSGAGKGAVSRIFQKHGIVTINADLLYHDLLRRNQSMKNELIAAFGNEILTNDRIDRKKLARIVFGSPDSSDLLHTLNTITHKYVILRIKKRLIRCEKQGVPAVAIDAPQLFEARLEQICDIVVGVLADPDIRLSRIQKRDHISYNAAMRRINAQHSDTFFKQRCHYIIQNNADLAEVKRDATAFLAANGLTNKE